MHEREFMKKWVRERLKLRKTDYWLRLSDSAEGTKPFDGILITRRDNETLPIAIEFKVWRAKGDFDFSTVEPHQMRELLAWERAAGLLPEEEGPQEDAQGEKVRVEVVVAHRDVCLKKGIQSQMWVPWCEMICEWFRSLGAKEAAYGVKGDDEIFVWTNFENEPDDELVADIILKEKFGKSPLLLEEQDTMLVRALLRGWTHFVEYHKLKIRQVAQAAKNVMDAAEAVDLEEFNRRMEDRHGLSMTERRP